MARVRQSLTVLQDQYTAGNKKPLEDLMRAWRGIKALDPSDPRSFFILGGYHGEPFRGPGATDGSYWGGYCMHGNVLFPLWHRIYLFKLEEALRSIPGCQDVTLPFWDETSEDSLKSGIPWALTNEKFHLDGEDIDNPLRSFVFPVDIVDNVVNDPVNYSKPKGYETVRYPLSGLVGTQADQALTAKHNAQYPNYADNVKILNENITFWLNSKQFTPPDSSTIVSTNLHNKYIGCLAAPNYTVFSNTTSSNAWNSGNNPSKKTPAVPIVALESPHNGMHLAVGGFEYPGQGTVDRIPFANGDMGENDTAGLDPIFYFHHCFIDRMFWLWQELHNATTALTIMENYPGTSSSDAQGPTPGYEPNEQLTLNSPLFPFEKADKTSYTGNDIIDVTKMGYSYGPGSLSQHEAVSFVAKASAAPPVSKLVHVKGIDRTAMHGSFVIAAYAQIEGKKELIGVEPVLSRWHPKGCTNCLTHPYSEAFVSIPTERHVVVAGGVNPAALLAGTLHVEVEIIARDKIVERHPVIGKQLFVRQPFQVDITTVTND